MGGGGGQIETRVLFNKRLYGIVSLVGRQSEYIKLHSRGDQGAERAIEPQAWANTPPPPPTLLNTPSESFTYQSLRVFRGCIGTVQSLKLFKSQVQISNKSGQKNLTSGHWDLSM